MNVWYCPEGHEHPNALDAIKEGCVTRAEVYPDSEPEPYVDWTEGH